MCETGRKSELCYVKQKKKDQNEPKSMEKRIIPDRWQEAWGRPGERKLQEKDIRKKGGAERGET